VIRYAQPRDVAVLVDLIGELAEYEEAGDQVRLSEEDLSRALFNPAPHVFAHVAVDGGAVVGFALWFLNYSTWTGRSGIYLEDLFVKETHRGRGYGAELLHTLISIAEARGYGRVDWSVLDWNAPAQEFYLSIGAKPMSEWTPWRLAINS
jgi:GNAT superfamily N-acetyltransferase